MKLYVIPGACSLAPHIALREAGLPFDLVEVDYELRRTQQGEDYYDISPKGYVPALLVKDGWLMTEVPVILRYIAERTPERRLAPRHGTRQGYRFLEWMTYVATEVHKSFSPLFRPSTPDAFLGPGREHLSKRLAVVETHLSANRYLLGPRYSLADAYLFTVCRWLKDQDLSLDDWPALQRHSGEIGRRSAVQGALMAEGLPAPEARSQSRWPRQAGHRRSGTAFASGAAGARL